MLVIHVLVIHQRRMTIKAMSSKDSLNMNPTLAAAPAADTLLSYICESKSLHQRLVMASKSRELCQKWSPSSDTPVW